MTKTKTESRGEQGGARQSKDAGAARGTRLVLALLLALGCGADAATASHGPRAANEPAETEAEVVVETPEEVVEPLEVGEDGASAVEVAANEDPPDETTESAGDPTEDEDAPAGHRTTRFFEHEDAPIVASLAESPITEVERGGGGRSLGFRVTLEDGTRGYFKPAQTFNGMHWYAEIAAYHLDRMLGLGRTAPSVGRRVAFSQLEEAARPDGRRDELIVDEDGTLAGVIIWWVPARLRGVDLPDGWQHWLRIEGTPPRVTPFQRPNQYAAGTRVEIPADAPDADPETRPGEMSDLIVFDYLIHNLDRFGGNNTNIRTIEDGGPVMFLDNAAGFTLGRPRIAIQDSRLHEVQRFRRSTIDAIRALDLEAYFAILDAEPLGPLLDARQRRNLGTRREHLLAYVDGLVERYGEERVYAF